MNTASNMPRQPVVSSYDPVGEEGLTVREIGHRKALLYKEQLAREKREAAEKAKQAMHFQDTTYIDEAPRRISTGSRRNAAPGPRRQSVDMPSHSYAPRRASRAREPSPDSSEDDQTTDWDERPHDYYYADEDPMMDEGPRRKSTGSRRKVVAEFPSRPDVRRQTLNFPQRSYASRRRRSASTRPLSPDSSGGDRTTGWDERPEDCYAADEVRQIWDSVIEEEAPLVDKGPHIERIISPWRLGRTVLALIILAFVLNSTDHSSRHLLLGLTTIVTAEYLCDYSWFQALSGLSLGFVFTVCVVLLFVFRRYTKPSVIGGFFLLGMSRLNFILHFVSPMATAAGISTQMLINFILGTSLIVMFIASSVWYCTSSFPIDNFRKFLKAFLTVGVGGGLVGYSFYHSNEFWYLEYLTKNHFIVPVQLLESAWVLNTVIVFGVAVLSLRVKHLSEVYDDVNCFYSDYFGPKRIQAVTPLCTRRSAREARRISEEFTRKELSKLQNTIHSMPDDILKATLSSETYLQIVHERESQGKLPYLWWLLTVFVGAVACGIYFY